MYGDPYSLDARVHPAGPSAQVAPGDRTDEARQAMSWPLTSTTLHPVASARQSGTSATRGATRPEDPRTV